MYGRSDVSHFSISYGSDELYCRSRSNRIVLFLTNKKSRFFIFFSVIHDIKVFDSITFQEKVILIHTTKK